MAESTLRPPAVRDAGTLADWVEVTMAIEERSLFAKANIRRRLAADGNDDEAAISLLLAEVRRRSRLSEQLYPYRVGSGGVQRVDVAWPAYDFMLVCSLEEASFRQEKDWSAPVQLFEHVVAAALSTLYGPDTQALRFGHPPDGQRPTGFEEAVGWLSSKMGVGRGTGRASHVDQDGGVDAVAWRSFRDGRVAFPVALTQCTLQVAFEQKGSDIVVPRWKQLLKFIRDPQVILAVPFSLGAQREAWDDLHFSVDVVLDRFRLCEMLEDVDLAGWPESNRLVGWLKRQHDLLRLVD